MSSLHPLSLKRSLLDPLHGLVRLTDEEIAVVDHPLFQRMRSIRQNGPLHLVFPGATHTRFLHSIGALHVADEMLEAILHNSDADADKLVREPALAAAGQAVCPPPGIREQLFRITRLAVLVHDLGHGPGSHAFDPFAPRVRQIEALIDREPALACLQGFGRGLTRYDKKGADAPISHEAMSCVLFARIWSDLYGLGSGVVEAVAAALLRASPRSLGPLQVLCPWLPVAGGIASSSPIDADRMDYMERDSRACGVTYGIFDRNRVLKSALCYRDEDGNYQLGWKYSGLRAIENFVQARFQLYAQIYYHKTNQAFSRMISRIGDIARDAGLNLFGAVRDLADLEARYLELSDDAIFLDRLAHADTRADFGAAPDSDAGPRLARLAGRITARRPWKRIYEARPDHAARVMLAAIRSHGCTAEIEHDEIAPKATKGLEHGASLLERGSGGIYCAPPAGRRERTWLDASPVLKTLHTAERELGRLYYTGDDDDELKAVRALVQRIIGGVAPGSADDA